MIYLSYVLSGSTVLKSIETGYFPRFFMILHYLTILTYGLDKLKKEDV